MLPKHAGFQTTPRTETKSAQRELNPHFRHGKAAGYRYIMGAESLVELSKNRVPGGTRTHVAADQPSVGARGAESWPLDDQCFSFSGIRGARTLADLVKSKACCH